MAEGHESLRHGAASVVCCPASTSGCVLYSINLVYCRKTRFIDRQIRFIDWNPNYQLMI